MRIVPHSSSLSSSSQVCWANSWRDTIQSQARWLCKCWGDGLKRLGTVIETAKTTAQGESNITV
jgi:hypothetical protein